MSYEPSELSALVSCFECIERRQRDPLKTYLLAIIAGASLDPSELMYQAKCFTCFDARVEKSLQNWLLCQLQTTLSCEPLVLSNAAKCFTCMTRDSMEVAILYLLALLAKISMDPVVLVSQSVCFNCIPNQKAVQNYLICLIAQQGPVPSSETYEATDDGQRVLTADGQQIILNV